MKSICLFAVLFMLTACNNHNRVITDPTAISTQPEGQKPSEPEDPLEITMQCNIQQQNASASVESSMADHDPEQNFLNNFYSINLDNMDIRTQTHWPYALNENGWYYSLLPGYLHSSPKQILPQISWDEKRQLLIMSSHNMTGTRACLKIHSCNLHAPLRGIFGPNSLDVARYAALIWAKSPTKCDAHLSESNFQTRSSLSADELIVFLVSGINKIESFSFAQADLEQQIDQQITFRYNQENKEVNIYIYHRKG